MAIDDAPALASRRTAAALLRGWRKRALLTQEQLAVRTGLSARTIRRVEAGRIQPRSASIRLLTEALGLDDDERARLNQVLLTTDHGPPVPPKATATGHVPRQLPADVAGFTGRADELARLDAHLAGEGQAGQAAMVAVAIAGTAGVGKTTLAVHWAHRVADRFPDGQLYVDLQGYGPGEPVSPVQALAQLLYGLGVEADKVPVRVEQAAGLYRSLLAGKRVLVVLDNARDAEQVRHLLPGSRSCMVVATSRSRLTGLVVSHGADRVVLDVLLPGEAVTLVERTLGPERVAAEPQGTAHLAALCGYLPLAVRIAAANLAAQPDLSTDGYLRRLLGTGWPGWRSTVIPAWRSARPSMPPMPP